MEQERRGFRKLKIEPNSHSKLENYVIQKMRYEGLMGEEHVFSVNGKNVYWAVFFDEGPKLTVGDYYDLNITRAQ